jgi:hypothetical protein
MARNPRGAHVGSGGKAVNEFIGECRREWKRLGVPRSAADEMAAELAADLHEGAHDEVLGSDAADPRAFARAWATERGLARGRRPVRLLAVLVMLALVPTIVGAVLTIDATRSDSPPFPLVQVPPAFIRIAAAPPTSTGKRTIVQAGAAEDDDGSLGVVLLIGGLALLVPATLLWSARVALNR